VSSPRTRPADVLGPPAARRAVLAAQGFGAARPSGPVTRRHLVRTLDRIRLLQLDSVNVAVRAHYMPLFSRLGRYQRALVDDAAWAHTARRPRLLVEYWAHEASLLPVADWPLLRSKAKREGWWRHYAVLVDSRPGLVDDVLAAVKELGPVGAGELETALGVATEPDLRDYYRIGPEPSRRAVGELVEAGELEPVEVRGWRQPAYRVPGTPVPRRVSGRALLCPFDPLIWERARTERVFGFRYRIEIYVPEPKREYGYYVFPFLLDGELVARVDVKADRRAGVLRVPGAFAEPGVDVIRVAAELAAELREMADWLELDGVVVGERGDLASLLASAVR
jgi:uncharacterized protein